MTSRPALARPTLAILAVILAVSCATTPASGDPVWGEVFPQKMPDGTTVPVRVWGDEFYRVVETLDGYTVVADPANGTPCYATLSADGTELISTGVSIAEPLAPGSNLPKHVRISKAAARAKAEAARARFAEVEAEHIANLQLRAALAAPNQGNVQGITLLVDFSDEVGTIPASSVNSYCNQVGYTGYGNNGSVRDYFYDISDGALTYTNFVPATYYRAVHPKTYYEDPSATYGVRARQLVVEALNNLNAGGFDFSQYDSNGDGLIDAINVFYAGYRGSVWAEGLWPHSSSVSFSADGVQAYRYQITDLRNSLALGTFCHENGHMICYWPDLYDYDFDSAGVGRFCVMCNVTSSTSPQEPCAYLKYIAGWSNTSLLTETTVGLSLPSDSNTFFKYQHPTNPAEYFIIENRQRTGRDSGIPTSGLAVWHVDENGSNRWQQQTPANHFECTLVQADGQWHLEQNLNSGDSGDLWRAPFFEEFDDDTDPSAQWWSGAVSGFRLWGIGESQSLMTFNFGHPPVIAPPQPVAEYPHAALKNRWISFQPDPTHAGTPYAYRVQHPASGASWYVSTPRSSAPEPGVTFLVSDTQPPYFDPAGLDLIHVSGCQIVPGELYEVVATPDAIFFSAPLTVETAPAPLDGRWWADVAGPFSTGGTFLTIPPTPANSWTPPDGLLNGFDITATLDAFRLNPSAPHVLWVDIHPESPDLLPNGSDILRVVNAFRVGTGTEFYPFRVPAGPGPQGQESCPAPPLMSFLAP